jgi:Peptidase family M28
VLAAPREAGTPEAVRARDAIAAYLSTLGFTVQLEPFRFAPSTLWALPVLGAGLGWLGLILLPLLVLPHTPSWGALVVWTVGAASLGSVAWGIGAGWTALPFGGAPREDANLVATRGPRVRRWIVAHLDSKAQGHSMAGRLGAVWMLVAAAVVLTVLAFARLRGAVPIGAAGVGAGLAVLTGALAGRGRLKGKSLGARDNASGVLAALTLAEALTDDETGILITGAEEFGLVGSRAFVQRHAAALRGQSIINLDTLDDTGALVVVRHDANGAALAEAVAATLAPVGLPAETRRLPLGILVDSLPLARAGAQAVTVARLDWSTLRRIHTAQDTADDLAFDTAERVGRALAASLPG